jgi:hypothetical protein
MEMELESLPTAWEHDVHGFSADGLLPPGDYDLARQRFEELFVSPSIRRQMIFEGWNSHREGLLHDGLPESSRQLLNGSFTTTKLEPGDIDLAVEVPITFSELVVSTDASPVRRLLLGPRMKTEYHCDAYPIYFLPKDDPHFERVTLGAIRYWTKWFAQTRSGQSKGRVWARTGGLR